MILFFDNVAFFLTFILGGGGGGEPQASTRVKKTFDIIGVYIL